MVFIIIRLNNQQIVQQHLDILQQNSELCDKSTQMASNSTNYLLL